MSKPEHLSMILVAGPCRSGTGDDPALIARNMQAMNEAALAVFRDTRDLPAGAAA